MYPSNQSKTWKIPDLHMYYVALVVQAASIRKIYNKQYKISNWSPGSEPRNKVILNLSALLFNLRRYKKNLTCICKTDFYPTFDTQDIFCKAVVS